MKGGEEDKEGRGKQLRKGNMCHTWHCVTLRHGDQEYSMGDLSIFQLMDEAPGVPCYMASMHAFIEIL